MLFARLIAVLVAMLVVTGAADAATPVKGSAPHGLRAFMFRADEPRETVYARTPSFAWKPVAGAVRYEFQLSTSSAFRDSGIIYSETQLKSPVASVHMTLPWITGSPHSLYARARAVLQKSTTPWSAPFGFSMRAPKVPTPLPSYPGLLRWTPVEGAFAYQVWFVDLPKMVTVYSNVIDEREFYTFHQATPWISSVRWRIRAMRPDIGPRPGAPARANSLPAATWGPWSPTYESVNPPFSVGPLTPLATVSDVIAKGTSSSLAHRLMPAFAFSGNRSFGNVNGELYRVYVYTDSDCINRVYTSAIVGGPAYAPRPFGPLSLPRNLNALNAQRGGYLLTDGEEGSSFALDGEEITTNESMAAAKPTTGLPKAEETGSTGSSGSTGGTGTTGPGTVEFIEVKQNELGAPVDLWDTNWPEGGYYWTVVPVEAKLSTTVAAGNLVYKDLELPQEVCAAGRVARFGKSSEPTLTTAGAPFASGLSASGRLVAARSSSSSFYGPPLVAWSPALGSAIYEVQWSKKRSPFKAEADPSTKALGLMTTGTSAVLPVTPGTWWYRVRGYNYSLPAGAQQMGWSDPARLVVVKPKFKVVKKP
jgi:hypothetical protein